MDEDLIAPHERFELHELLTFKNLCAVKASAMSGLAKDPELKSILQSDVIQTKQQITELRSLLMTANQNPMNTASLLMNPTYSTTGRVNDVSSIPQ